MLGTAGPAALHHAMSRPLNPQPTLNQPGRAPTPCHAGTVHTDKDGAAGARRRFSRPDEDADEDAVVEHDDDSSDEEDDDDKPVGSRRRLVRPRLASPITLSLAQTITPFMRLPSARRHLCGRQRSHARERAQGHGGQRGL